jgi:3-methyladenine DNA glycosylase AlkD
MKYQEIVMLLKSKADEKYGLFSKKIVNTQLPVIGVRSPAVEKIIKEVMATGGIEDDAIWHQYFETDTVIGVCQLRMLKTDQERFAFLSKFLKETVNWATVDTMAGSFRSDDFQMGWSWIERFASSSYPFIRRYAFIHILVNFISQERINAIFKLIKKDDHYYVRMGQAWLISYCFMKCPKPTETFLIQANIDDWTINKSISKIVDSFRVSDEDKERLKKYRRHHKTK